MNQPNKSAAGKQVFVSYSHAPEENAAFVRNLAGRLTTAGYSVWLDEEQISGGDFERQILAAAKQSEIAVFVVTQRWRDRPWTRHELQLFGERSSREEDIRLVVLMRDEIDPDTLGPYLSMQHRIDWRVNDGEFDARFWQTLCGIERQPLGPKKDWAAKGRAAGASIAHPGSVPVPAPRIRPVRKADQAIVLPVASEGRPIELVPFQDSLFLVTDRGEWIGMTATDLLPPLPRLAGALAWTEDAAGKLVVATCDSMLARLQSDSWDYWRLAAPALSLCSIENGLYAGTVSGAVMQAGRAKSETLGQQREAVIALAAPSHDTLYTLGAQGQLGRVALDGSQKGETRWLDAADLGRTFGFFPGAEAGRIGLFSATAVGFIDASSTRIKAAPARIEDGVRDILFLGPGRWPFAILTDGGRMLLASADLDRLQRAPLPPQALVVGCCAGTGTALAAVWTREGRLYIIDQADGARCLVESGVMMAAPVPGTGALAAATAEANGETSMRIVPP